MGKWMRPITVGRHRLRWRFDDVLVVVPAKQSGPRLCVDWGWVDWLEPDGPGAEPLVITPKFVAAAVQAALLHGWDPDANGPPLRLIFKDGNFAVNDSSSLKKAR